jgi:tRNA threonylcarbamoyladenosine biosynthesis protein TsaE
MREERAGFLLRNRAETESWGRALGACLRPGDVVALIGDLGAGKTTLTQAIGRGMGLSARVTSPTFTLIQEYPGRVPMFHIDPYRLENPEAMADLGFDEYFERGGVVVVEWANRLTPLLPEARLNLTLEIVSEAGRSRLETADVPSEPGEQDEEPRRLTAEAVGPRYAALLAELCALPEIALLREADTP